MRTLVVRLSALGDLVHTLPVVAALRRGDPTGRIDWLVDERFKELVDLVPAIDRRMTWPRRGSSLSSYYRAIRELRRERYDVALDVQGLFKSGAAAWLGGATRVVGFDRTGLREPAASWFHTERALATSPGHVIEKNLTLVSHLGVDPRPWSFPIETPPTSVVARVREQLSLDGEEPFVVVNPGSAWPSKCWPPARYGELAQRMSAELGSRVVVAWGPGEQDLAAAVVDAAAGAAVLAPPTDIRDLVSLLRAASLVVGGDTGPLHLAMAARTPVVAIYGPSDPVRNGPWGPADVVVRPASSCPCLETRRAQGGRGVVVRRCEEPHHCLEDVSVDDVLDAVQRRLATDRPSHV